MSYVCYRLLVGAPRAKALRGQTSKVTGGLYNCDMSTNSNACSRVVFDNTGEISTDTCAFLSYIFVFQYLSIPFVSICVSV